MWLHTNMPGSKGFHSVICHKPWSKMNVTWHLQVCLAVGNYFDKTLNPYPWQRGGVVLRGLKAKQLCPCPPSPRSQLFMWTLLSGCSKLQASLYCFEQLTQNYSLLPFLKFRLNLFRMSFKPQAQNLTWKGITASFLLVFFNTLFWGISIKNSHNGF